MLTLASIIGYACVDVNLPLDAQNPGWKITAMLQAGVSKANICVCLAAQSCSRVRRRIDSVCVRGYNLVSMSRRNRPFLPLLVFLLLISPIMVQLAYGYLDPGTGSYILQLLVGGLLGGLFAIGVFWKKVVTFVKRLFTPQNRQ
jgi:hypothetical protein